MISVPSIFCNSSSGTELISRAYGLKNEEDLALVDKNKHVSYIFGNVSFGQTKIVLVFAFGLNFCGKVSYAANNQNNEAETKRKLKCL